MERTVKEDAKYKIVYKPTAYFEWKLYKKGLFGWWWKIGESWYKHHVEQMMQNDMTYGSASNNERYYK